MMMINWYLCQVNARHAHAGLMRVMLAAYDGAVVVLRDEAPRTATRLTSHR